MIIILGPDHSGKTTLARQLEQLGMQYWHPTEQTDYPRYLNFLIGGRSTRKDIHSPFIYGPALDRRYNYVLDRFFYCEGPYSEVLRGEQQRWSLKELHNLHLLTLAHNPLIILTTRKGPGWASREQLIEEEMFDDILTAYRTYLPMYDLPYIEWDWKDPPMSPQQLHLLSVGRHKQVIWWRNLAKRGIGGIGNTINPRVLVLAEEIGPSNYHNLPFETGPSGHYLTELLEDALVPLNSFYLTNWHRHDTERSDAQLLSIELEHLHPEAAILLGNEARKAAPTIASFGIDKILTLRHPGWVVNHSENRRELASRKADYAIGWKTAWREALAKPSPAKEKMKLKSGNGTLPRGAAAIKLAVSG